LALWVQPGWKRKGVALLELEAVWQVRWLVGVRRAFLSEGALDWVPGEKSELEEWVKAVAEQEEWV
jgi:hypothetical protein